MMNENLETQVKAVLDRYASDLVMVDLFWLWAKYGFGDDEDAIRGNIMRRYELTPAQAEEVVKKCKEECSTLVQSRNVDPVRQAMLGAMSPDYEHKLRDRILSEASRASFSARWTIGLVNWLAAEGMPSHRLEYLFSDSGVLALLRATLGSLPGTSVGTLQEIRGELIRCGVLNRIVLISKKDKRRDEYKFGPAIPPISLPELIIDQAVFSPEPYVATLFDLKMFEQARVLEEIAIADEGTIPGVKYGGFGKQGVPPEDVVPSKGILGFAEEYNVYGKITVAAVNPMIRGRLMQVLVDTKARRVAAAAERFARAIRGVRNELWPKGELTTLKDQPDRKIYRLDQIGVTSLFIYVGNWLSESDLRSLRDLGADPNRDSFLIVVTDQSLPSLKAVVASSLKMWEKPSIAVVILADKDITSHQLQREAHPSVARILGLLGGKDWVPPRSLGVTLTVTPTSVLVGTEVTAKVQVRDDRDNPVQGAEIVVSWGDADSRDVSEQRGTCSARHKYAGVGTYRVAVRATKNGFNPGEDEKRVIVSLEPGPPRPPAIRVGNLSDHGQHGLLGRIDDRDVLLDLYEPHAITVLGVQGSGKSYAAGAIIEMAVRSIPGISTLTKPLSCIIFHFSKEETRVPEWIGLASPNSSPSQTERLRIEYGTSPDSVPHTNINVLVPPTKVSDRRKQYPDFNVIPLVFSPSKLKADDWKRLLTFGKGSDALYMEALRDLMIDLRDKKANFDTNDLKDEITKSDLEKNQKKFALQRIKTIGRWLSQDVHPFVDLLKPGVVNIVDLRDPLAVDAEMASLVLQTVFSFVKDRPPDGICLVAIDEAHLFFEHEHLTKEIIEFVAQLRRIYKVYLLLMSQQPGRFHPDILALSDVIICYRLESDRELDFLKKNKPAFADVTKDTKKLKTGEGKAFLWARVSTDDALEKPRLISVRPKVTEDRGKTATAF